MRSGWFFTPPLFVLLLCTCYCDTHLLLVQVDDCGFSLSHPNQFFFESQRILSGGKDIKKDSVQPETPQPRPSVQRSKDSSSTLDSLSSALDMDLEELEELLQ